MLTDNGNVAQALFESVDDDGVRWQFICMPDGRWKITRGGRRVAVGTGDRQSVQAGIAKFVSLTARPAGAATCDPSVLEKLDRIKAKEPRRSTRDQYDQAECPERTQNPDPARAEQRPRV